MNTNELILKANEIEKMGSDELLEFGQTVDMSSLVARQKYFLYEAIEKRILQLDANNSNGYIVEFSELREGEV